jgi:aminoglycoside 6'-N-acetyltransferase I
VIEVRPFETLHEDQLEEAARILMQALAHAPAAYHMIKDARAEVSKLANEDRLGFAALRADRLVGWIGAIRTYDRGWELHPLVVHPDCQRSGVGTRLVRALEERARRQGILTLYLGTDDDFGGTTLFGVELYPDPLEKLAAIAPANGHPFTFYRRVGFVLAGVLPDVNGAGRPDIFMTKKIV